MSVISVHQSHPNYWVSVMTFSAIYLALAFNFLFLHPTFLVFGAPNQVWGGIFFVLAIGQGVLLKTRQLKFLRMLMTYSIIYMAVLGAGTSRPFLDHTGSLQLPIMYIGLATLLVPLRAEPPSNPLTMRKPKEAADAVDDPGGPRDHRAHHGNPRKAVKT